MNQQSSSSNHKIPAKPTFRSRCARPGVLSWRSVRGVLSEYPAAQIKPVKPARLHFARTARALTGRYIHVCEQGVLSECPAACARASYWFDKLNQLLNQYICARERLKILTVASLTPGRAQREPQGYACFTTKPL